MKAKMKFGRAAGCVAMLAAVGLVFSQEKTGPAGAGGPGAGVGGVETIKIEKPLVDKATGRVTLAGAFWNEKLADWVEVGLCGRPSDFLHETVLSVPTTRALLEGALREAGFHDADAWVSSVKDFPRVRGDKMLVTAEFMREGKKETFSLDEMIGFEGWGVSAGPYGFMFRGDPGRNLGQGTTQPANGGAGGGENAADIARMEGAGAAVKGDDTVDDASKILHDDPQISLVFKGLQSVSQSFADHPLAYDDWVYPMLDFGRNYAVLPDKVYDSNGSIPVTVVFQKVTEEAFLRESARVWHDAAYAQYILKQVPTAQQIDKDKAAYWGLVQELPRAGAPPATTRDPLHDLEVNGQLKVLAAQIESGYATLDAAWAAWGAEHLAPGVMTGGKADAKVDPRVEAELKRESSQWREHLALKQTSAEQRAIAEGALYDQERATNALQTEAVAQKMQQLRGVEIAARSKALLADNQEPSERWKAEQAHIDPSDPRADWIKEIALHVEMADAQQALGKVGIDYGKALQASAAGANVAELQKGYAMAALRVNAAGLRLDLADLDFEIGKREGFDNDPELPGLREKRKQVAAELQALEAATQPATGRG